MTHGAIRWGVIGTGDISGRLVPDLTAIPAAAVSAVWGRASDRAADFAQAHAIAQSTADLDALLSRDDIDAVHVATPIGTHLGNAAPSLGAGKRVQLAKSTSRSPGPGTASALRLPLSSRRLNAGLTDIPGTGGLRP